MERVKKYLSEHQEEMLRDLESLIKIPSVKSEAAPNAPYGENCAKAVKKAEEILAAAGLKVKNTGNFVLTADLGEGEPELGILCHLDVVPEGSGWTFPPYELNLSNGRLYGRGAIDNKGPAVAAFYAMKAIKDLNIPLKKSVRLILGSDEENGSSDLTEYLKTEKLPPMLFTPDGDYPVINLEKGMARFELKAKISQLKQDKRILKFNGGKTINAIPAEANALVCGYDESEILTAANEIENAEFKTEKLGEAIKIIALGKNAHASTPELGVNALTALLALLQKLNPQGETSDKLSALLNAFPYGETNGLSAGLKASDEISGDLTLAFTVLNANENEISANLDIRFPLCESVKSVTDKLKKAVEQNGLKVNLLMGDEPHHVPEESEFIQALLKVYEAETGDKGYCKAIGGGTYVHNTAGGVAFGAEFPGEENNMHGADESIKLESLIKNTHIIAHAILELCGK